MGDSSEEDQHYMTDLQSKYHSLRQKNQQESVNPDQYINNSQQYIQQQALTKLQPKNITLLQSKVKKSSENNKNILKNQPVKIPHTSTQFSEEYNSAAAMSFQYIPQNQPPKILQSQKYNQLRPSTSKIQSQKQTITSPQKQMRSASAYKSSDNLQQRVQQQLGQNHNNYSNNYNNVYNSIEFEPSQYYLYEKKKHEYAVSNKSDRLKNFQRMNQLWKSDRFLSNNHAKHPNESREGRKLNLAEYNSNFKKQQVVRKNPNNAPQYKLSTYVIPSERKRDDVRYEIRMKMLRANAMQVNSSFSGLVKKKRPCSAAPKKSKSSVLLNYKR